MEKITHLIDVEAPCAEVFDTIANIDKRMQLSPLWGISRLAEISSDYPQPGSSYKVQVMPGAPYGISQGTLNPSQSALAGLAEVLFLKMAVAGENPSLDDSVDQSSASEKMVPSETATEQEYCIDAFQPPNLLSYHLDYGCRTLVTWHCQAIHSGTRITYEESFCDERVVDNNFLPMVRGTVQEWLTNIKHYSELRTDRRQRFIKWFLDRFYLKLMPDQRKVVLMMLVMQAIGLGTFTLAAMGWLIARVLF